MGSPTDLDRGRWQKRWGCKSGLSENLGGGGGGGLGVGLDVPPPSHSCTRSNIVIVNSGSLVVFYTR